MLPYCSSKTISSYNVKQKSAFFKEMYSIRCFLVLFMQCLIFDCDAAKLFETEPRPCHSDVNTTSNQTCDSCVEFMTVKSKTDSGLFEMLDTNNIIFNKTDNNTLSWTCEDVDIGISHDNITLTLYTWNIQTRRGRPLPGCCGVSLTTGACTVVNCVDGDLFVAVSFRNYSAAKRMRVDLLRSCSSKRSKARYFNICTSEMTPWRMRYNCECVVYDSRLGYYLPGNSTTFSKGLEPEVWYSESLPVDYEVCVFNLPKADVMQRGVLHEDSMVMDSVVFQRGVYYMNGFSSINGSIMDSKLNITVNCTSRTFQGTELYNITSAASVNPDLIHDNDTFICMSQWPNGTRMFSAEGTHVKCMPQNETFSSKVYEEAKVDQTFLMVVMVLVPLCGAILLAILICCVARKIHKKVNKFIHETKEVPEELESVMKMSFANKPSSNYYNVVYKEESYDAFDKEERERITMRTADKRVQREDEYSDSEDEGEGGRKNQQSHKKKRKVEGEGNSINAQGKSDTSDDVKSEKLPSTNQNADSVKPNEQTSKDIAQIKAGTDSTAVPSGESKATEEKMET